MFYEKNSGGPPFFVFGELEAIPGFVHAVTSRRTDAELKDAGDGSKVAPRKIAFLDTLGVEPHRLVLLNQVHSDHVLAIDQAYRQDSAGHYIGDGDGILLTRPGYFSVVRTADCVPILGVLPERKMAFSFHAGWRGTCARIAEKGIAAFLKLSGARPDELIVALGPSIRSCCYEVGSEVRDSFAAQQHPVDRLFSNRHLDLIEANRLQILEQGVGKVLDAEACTACRTDLFYSYRKEGQTGRLWTLAGFRGQ